MRLASCSIVLLLCGSIFLRIPSDIRALATFSDIAGKYRLERGSMTMCRPSAVVRNQGNILPANSISFGGEDCRFDTVALREDFGLPGLSTVFPHLLNTPLIEYSNLLNTEVVHGLGSLPK